MHNSSKIAFFSPKNVVKRGYETHLGSKNVEMQAFKQRLALSYGIPIIEYELQICRAYDLPTCLNVLNEMNEIELCAQIFPDFFPKI